MNNFDSSNNNDSGDEWCLVEEQEALFSPRVHGPKPVEPEAEPAETEEEPETKCIVANESNNHVAEDTTSARTRTAEVDDDDVDDDNRLVCGLLQGADASPRPYSRELMLALLAPSHRRQLLVGSDAPCATRKRSVRVAFASPTARVHVRTTHADRLRAAVPSRRASAIELARETTRVEPFTCSIATQTEAGEPQQTQEAVVQQRVSLSSALERSLGLAMRVKSQAQELERREWALRGAKEQVDETTRQRESQAKHARILERRLDLATKREELANDYNTHLQRQVDELRVTNTRLQGQVEFLTGGIRVEDKSLTDLEALEDELEQALGIVRATLRAKYRAAMGSAPRNCQPQRVSSSNQVDNNVQEQEDEAEPCVVCLERPVSVRLVPCGHHVLCPPCALLVSACPIDRAEIADKVLTHGLNAYHDAN